MLKNDVCIAHVSVAVPAKTVPNTEREFKAIGIKQTRHAPVDVTASALCVAAAEQIFAQQPNLRTKLKVLIFVTQTPDHLTPATACKIQHKLGMGTDVLAFDVNLGCSGWTSGLIMSRALATMHGPVLLLVGDTGTHICDALDSATRPIFSDAGSATILWPDGFSDWFIDFGTDGSGADAIMSNSYVARSVKEQTPLSPMKMDGAAVYDFATSRVPESIKKVCPEVESHTRLVLHQANKRINHQIATAGGFAPEQVIHSLPEYGNTMGASLAVTLCANAHSLEKSLDYVFSGYGVGLSWSSIRYRSPIQMALYPVLEV